MYTYITCFTEYNMQSTSVAPEEKNNIIYRYSLVVHTFAKRIIAVCMIQWCNQDFFKGQQVEKLYIYNYFNNKKCYNIF